MTVMRTANGAILVRGPHGKCGSNALAGDLVALRSAFLGNDRGCRRIRPDRNDPAADLARCGANTTTVGTATGG